jgi:hypothetical protein
MWGEVTTELILALSGRLPRPVELAASYWTCFPFFFCMSYLYLVKPKVHHQASGVNKKEDGVPADRRVSNAPKKLER